jgi:DNA repair protein RadA/Sms
MNKLRTAFFCSHCGYESAKWLGKCPSCQQWNTFLEEVLEKPGNKHLFWQKDDNKKGSQHAKTLNEVTLEVQAQIVTPDLELNRVLGGGIVPGALILLAGEPGIGKSTLLLQVALQMRDISILYISGEESEQQIRMRANRLGLNNDNFYLLTETSTTILFNEIKKLKPQVVIIDSIQTLRDEQLDTAAGSITQIRECAASFQRFAKETNTSVFLIGHITKDGSIAGPKLLEHLVDTVLQFEGERHYAYRILRTLKNRFGSTNELGIYEMTGDGMKGVANPSDIFIHQKEEVLSGSAICAGMEGLRPMLFEIQALVTQSVYGTPQRTINGMDLRKLQLLLAVLEKRGGFHFGVKDVFVNIAGGLRMDDPSIDLGTVCALLSSYEDLPIPLHYCFAGEVGLNGEIRAVQRIEQRITEAAKMGFEKIFISPFNKIRSKKNLPIEVVEVSMVEGVYHTLFNK